MGKDRESEFKSREKKCSGSGSDTRKWGSPYGHASQEQPLKQRDVRIGKQVCIFCQEGRKFPFKEACTHTRARTHTHIHILHWFVGLFSIIAQAKPWRASLRKPPRSSFVRRATHSIRGIIQLTSLLLHVLYTSLTPSAAAATAKTESKVRSRGRRKSVAQCKKIARFFQISSLNFPACVPIRLVLQYTRPVGVRCGQKESVL